MDHGWYNASCSFFVGIWVSHLSHNTSDFINFLNVTGTGSPCTKHRLQVTHQRKLIGKKCGEIRISLELRIVCSLLWISEPRCLPWTFGRVDVVMIEWVASAGLRSARTECHVVDLL